MKKIFLFSAILIGSVFMQSCTADDVTTQPVPATADGGPGGQGGTIPPPPPPPPDKGYVG